VGTSRRHVWIDRSADDVWGLVGDPAAMGEWFPHTRGVTVDGTTRVITLESGIPISEEIVSIRNDLRRFQYRLLGPMRIRHHLATIDVIPGVSNGDGGEAVRCLVVYSTEVEPHALTFVLDGAVGEALENLKRVMEAA
jgi:hypothetical protein